MSGKIAVLGLSLFLVVRALAAAPPTANQSPAVATAVTFEILNVTPASQFTIKFGHGRFAAGVELPKGAPQALKNGFHIQDGTLTFNPPAGSLAAGFSKIAFMVPVAFSGPGDGSFEAKAPMVALINAGWGAVSTQGGAFHAVTDPLPETCTLGCLEKGARCGKRPGAGCYLYDNNYMCCLVCPTGC
jgi:hypothetical protein